MQPCREIDNVDRSGAGWQFDSEGDPPTSTSINTRDKHGRTLQEQRVLRLGDLHGARAILVIICNVVDPRADRIAPHQPCIVGLQQLRDDLHVGHPRIEPEIVRIGMENDWHTVMDARRHGIRGRGEDRAGT